MQAPPNILGTMLWKNRVPTELQSERDLDEATITLEVRTTSYLRRRRQTVNPRPRPANPASTRLPGSGTIT